MPYLNCLHTADSTAGSIQKENKAGNKLQTNKQKEKCNKTTAETITILFFSQNDVLACTL